MAIGLCDEIRKSCAQIVASARWVRIDEAAFARVAPGAQTAELDPEIHFLEGEPADVADYLLALDAINFGSGWFPLLVKRPGRSGYVTIASALSEHYRRYGPLRGAELRAMTTVGVAAILGQRPDLELMSLYAQALRSLGAFLGERSALELARASPGAEHFAQTLVGGMALFDDRCFYKRAQIAAADLVLANLVRWPDIDRLTIFADNLVPHVLRVEGVLRYDKRLARLIDGGGLLRAGGPQEREIRACAVHACEALAHTFGVSPRLLDNWLWNRGQEDRFKALPRHRCRTVFY